jgi:hypothetical protein
MNQEQKGQRYDWLLGQYRQTENEIKMIPKLPLEETLKDVNSKEYTPENLNKVNQLKIKLQQIDAEVKRLFIP